MIIIEEVIDNVEDNIEEGITTQNNCVYIKDLVRQKNQTNTNINLIKVKRLMKTH